MKALNKKLIIGTVLMCSMMSASVVTPAVAANYTTPSIVIDSRTISSDTDPFIIDGTTLVPLRVISENLGASVDWDATTRTVTVTKGNTTIKLTVDEYLAYINGEAVTVSMSPRIINNRTMVPLRFIGETFDCQVGWDGETKTVTITTNGKAAPPFEQAQVDSFGRAIRTTNLPSNASMFPYIAEEIPNWAYETQTDCLKNNYWGPGYYKDTGFKGDTAKDLTESKSGLYPILASEGVYELVDKFVNLQTNIDYNTIDEAWVKDMLSCFSDTEIKGYEADWKGDEIETVEEDLQSYIKYTKEEKRVTSCEAKVMPEALWVDIYGYPHIPVYIKYTIDSCNIKEGLCNMIYGNPGAASVNATAAYEIGQPYEAVITYTLNKDSKGKWKITWRYSDLDTQILPGINLTDGVKVKDSNQCNKFEYDFLKDGIYADRHEIVGEDKLHENFNMITGHRPYIIIN